MPRKPTTRNVRLPKFLPGDLVRVAPLSKFPPYMQHFSHAGELAIVVGFTPDAEDATDPERWIDSNPPEFEYAICTNGSPHTAWYPERLLTRVRNRDLKTWRRMIVQYVRNRNDLSFG